MRTELLSPLRSEEPIPGGLLLSRAHFRFGSTGQISNPNTIFTNCRKKQPRLLAHVDKLKSGTGFLEAKAFVANYKGRLSASQLNEFERITKNV